MICDIAELVPDPLYSDRQFDRYYHIDLPQLEDTDLIDELNCLRVFLWGLHRDHWLRQRVAALETESARRARGRRPGDSLTRKVRQ